MESLKPFAAAVSDPLGYAQKRKALYGQRSIAHFCSYTPEELIHAAGHLPLRLFGSRQEPLMADRHLQRYCCRPIRNLLQAGLSGEFDGLDGIVFTHTCDSMQRLSDIWRMSVPTGFSADVIWPLTVASTAAREYAADVLRRFKTELEQHFGIRISSPQIAAAAVTFNRLRGYLKTLAAIRQTYPGIIGGRDFQTIVQGAMIIDRQDLLTLLPAVLAELREHRPETAHNAKRVILSGSVCDGTTVFDIVEAAGGVVVWEESCTGSRSFDPAIDIGDDPLTAIADAYLAKAICPARHSTLTARGDRLVDIVRASKADGVLFVLMKFCDPHAFDYPYLKSYLREKDIAAMSVDIDGAEPVDGQLRTRCEAFIEML